MLLLHSAGMTVYAGIAGSLLLVQFVAVYARVLPYLHSTFGGTARCRDANPKAVPRASAYE